MPMFMNPFAKHDVSEFPGVLVPLSQAQRHSSAVLMAKKKDDKEGLSPPSSEKGERRSSTYNIYTIEGLRAEVEADVAAGGHSTTYDRE